MIGHITKKNSENKKRQKCRRKKLALAKTILLKTDHSKKDFALEVLDAIFTTALKKFGGKFLIGSSVRRAPTQKIGKR